MSQINYPLIYVNDPTTSRSVFDGFLYFCMPDTAPIDMTNASNQKNVRAVQENGDLINLTQPVRTNSGGNPTYNGSPVVLDIDGSYSFQALDRLGAQIVYVANVENAAPGSSGFSGVVVTEEVVLSAGQTTVSLSTVGANESVFYIQTSIGDQGFLNKDTDYTVTNSTTIELTSSRNAGDKIVGRQNDPTGQLVPVNDDAESLLVFGQLSDAQSSAVSGNLTEGDTVTLNGNAANGDGKGGDKYIVQLTGPANDGVNYLDLNGTLQLALQNNLYRFQNYSEKIVRVNHIASGILNIDLSVGVVYKVTLSADVTDIVFVGQNPNSEYSSTVAIEFIQDGAGGHGVVFPVAFKWAGGLVPTVSAGANERDKFVFELYDSIIDGITSGSNFS